MENLGSAISSPFQGPQGAENALKLAGILAPRINLGGRPLQPGEGEGLRNLFSAFGQFAEQKRRKEAEGQVLSGLEAVMQGKTPIASLPVSDLPETMQRVLFEQVAQNAKRGAMSPAERVSLMNAVSTVADRGGDPISAMKALGLSLSREADFPPSSSPSPRGAVTMSPEEALAPSLLQQSTALPDAPGSVFGQRNAALRAQEAHERLSRLIANSQGVLRRSDVIAALSGMPADDAKFQVRQLELAGLLPDDLFARTQEAREKYPDFFPPDVQATMKTSGPEIQFKPRTPHNLPPSHAGIVTGPQGQELSRIAGPPPPLPEMERMIQLLPPALQGGAREVYTGMRPKAGEARRADETERYHKAIERAKAEAEKKLAESDKRVAAWVENYLHGEDFADQPGEKGWFSDSPAVSRREAAAADLQSELNPQLHDIKLRAYQEAFGGQQGGVPDDHVPATGQQKYSEPAFRNWYAGHATAQGLNPNPDDPLHQYDYRAAYRAGATPDTEGHWPSKFKRAGHPNLIVDGLDTRTGRPPRVKPPQQAPRQGSRPMVKTAEDFFKKYSVGE